MSPKASSAKEKESPQQPTPIAVPPASSGPDRIERVRRLQAELDNERQGAVEDILAKRKELDAMLVSFGYTVDGETRSKTRRTRATIDASKRHCKVCDMDGHDKRAHRSQPKNKMKKFTAEELKQMGLA